MRVWDASGRADVCVARSAQEHTRRQPGSLAGYLPVCSGSSPECRSDRLSIPAHSDMHFGASVQVLKECVHPVLFVPSTQGVVERSPS